jgi:hypothetical protein
MANTGSQAVRHGTGRERERERRRWPPASGEGGTEKGNCGGVHRKGKSPSPVSREEREGDAASSPTTKPATVPFGLQCVKSYHMCLNCSYLSRNSCIEVLCATWKEQKVAYVIDKV